MLKTCLLCWCAVLMCGTAAAYEAAPPRDVDLNGYWKLNAALSDDAEEMLQKRLTRERKEYERRMRRARENDPYGLPPLGDPPLPEESSTSPPAPAPRQERPSRRFDPLRELLGFTATLEIAQQGTRIDMVSDYETRRLQAGSRSQVSMPEGEIADSQVGWDGEWFVIDRKVRRGPRIVEKYRLLKKTGQLEWLLSWGGEHLLSGIKVRRVFDRGVKDTRVSDPALGPGR